MRQIAGDFITPRRFARCAAMRGSANLALHMRELSLAFNGQRQLGFLLQNTKQSAFI